MNATLTNAIFGIGIGQLCVLVASALVPIHLNWKARLRELPDLVRQLFWVYGGYVVLSIISLGLICLINARELAGGSVLARSFCLYGMIFWGIRLSLQPVLTVKPFLTKWWLAAGYHLLTILFTCFVLVYGWGLVH